MPLNVLILTVDALRADRTSLHGYGRPTTPTFERLAANAVVCERAFALGTFTQSACVQMLTSSRPLSYGGYDHGAQGRPESLFKRLNDNGYRTISLSTLHWVNKYFGYGPGLDEETPLYILNTFPGMLVAMVRDTLAAFDKGIIGEDAMLRDVGPMLTKFFADVTDYCHWQIDHGPTMAADFPDSSIVNSGYDYGRVLALVARHEREFNAHPAEYVRERVLPCALSERWMQMWLPAEWYYLRRRGRLVEEAVHRLGNRLLRPFAPRLARARDHRFKNYVDAAALADRLIKTLETVDRSRPFCLWTHFMDTHVPYVSGRGRTWYRQTPEYLRALGHRADHGPGVVFDLKPRRLEDEAAFAALYDAAVLATDREIGRVIDALDRLGLRDDTLVVISGDHGEELGEHGNWGHYFLLYDHNTRVPLMFHHPSFGARRIGHLTTILDFAPTVTDMLGVPPAAAWEGQPVTAPDVARRGHVLMETFYGGNCLFKHRPLYFGVRTDQLLYLWKEDRDPKDRYSLDGPELYDLAVDPGQRTNLYRDGDPRVDAMNALIAARMAEIPEIAPERIARAFGTLAASVVAR